MGFEGAAELIGRGGLGHFGQRFRELLFGVVEISQLVYEQSL
jgi:hypothetical protein